MVFNTTFNNISVISWLSVLMVEKTGVLGENYRPTVLIECKNRHCIVTLYQLTISYCWAT